MSASPSASPFKVFIDGEAGTTGLGIRDRLAVMPRIEVRSIDPALRKDPGARAELMASVDVVILCLPDAAAKESVALAATLGDRAPRMLDASTAHRVADGWVYGFPELAPDQPAKIAAATHVANPGCYPTGAIALMRPLVDAGVLPSDYPVAVHAVSGYSGGGKSMIEAYESGEAPAYEIYGLALSHKHLPEMTRYSRLSRAPIFVPAVGKFRQGMLVNIGLHASGLAGKPSRRDIEAILEARYAGSRFVRVVPVNAGDSFKLEPEALNDTNLLELRVYGNDDHGQLLLVARLDNLGKGASGAAVQNLEVMLGL